MARPRPRPAERRSPRRGHPVRLSPLRPARRGGVAQRLLRQPVQGDVPARGCRGGVHDLSRHDVRARGARRQDGLPSVSQRHPRGLPNGTPGRRAVPLPCERPSRAKMAGMALIGPWTPPGCSSTRAKPRCTWACSNCSRCPRGLRTTTWARMVREFKTDTRLSSPWNKRLAGGCSIARSRRGRPRTPPISIITSATRRCRGRAASASSAC